MSQKTVSYTKMWLRTYWKTIQLLIRYDMVSTWRLVWIVNSHELHKKQMWTIRKCDIIKLRKPAQNLQNMKHVWENCSNIQNTQQTLQKKRRNRWRATTGNIIMVNTHSEPTISVCVLDAFIESNCNDGKGLLIWKDFSQWLTNTKASIYT
jgi:hypothetical protein